MSTSAKIYVGRTANDRHRLSSMAKLSSSQALANHLTNRLQHLDAGVPLAVGLDDRPWGVRRSGAVQHLINGFAVLIHLFPISPIVLSDPPLLVKHSLPFPYPPHLLVGDAEEPELEQDRPKV